MSLTEELKKEIITEMQAGDLVWTVYCFDCEKVIDKAVNGALMEAAAKIHAYKTGHRVILGNVFKRR